MHNAIVHKPITRPIRNLNRKFTEFPTYPQSQKRPLTLCTPPARIRPVLERPSRAIWTHPLIFRSRNSHGRVRVNLYVCMCSISFCTLCSIYRCVLLVPNWLTLRYDLFFFVYIKRSPLNVPETTIFSYLCMFFLNLILLSKQFQLHIN